MCSCLRLAWVRAQRAETLREQGQGEPAEAPAAVGEARVVLCGRAGQQQGQGSELACVVEFTATIFRGSPEMLRPTK